MAESHVAGVVTYVFSWFGKHSTPPWRIRLRARVDRADQTMRIYTQKYVKMSQNGRAYYFKGIKLCRLIAKINTLQPDAPRWSRLLAQYTVDDQPGPLDVGQIGQLV